MSSLAVVASPGTHREDWDAAIDGVLADARRISINFQPIADLNRGVVTGFEALARFRGEISASPDVWFREAERRGKGIALELFSARRALESVRLLPANCFLTINVSPALLLSPAWSALVADVGRLDSIIVEVTEHAAITDYDEVRSHIARIRALGGGFAVDDAGSGFASLNHVLALRPDFVKLDRVFVSGCDTDPAKRALIEMMGAFSGRLDAWIIAEGVESIDELKALSSLRVPLAQGYLLGRPQPSWSGIDPQVTAHLASWRTARLNGKTIAVVTERAPIVMAADRVGRVPGAASDSELLVVVDDMSRPVAIIARGLSHTDEIMRVKASSDAAEVLRRALTRRAAARFSPLAVVNDLGHVEGVVRVERLIELVAFDEGETSMNRSAEGPRAARL